MFIQPNSFIFNLGVATILSIIIGFRAGTEEKALRFKNMFSHRDC